MMDLTNLKPGLKGTSQLVVGVEHTAPSIGMLVTASAVLTAVEDRALSFAVEAHDAKEPIGGGTHQRVVVNVARFDARVQRKLGKE